MNGRKKYFIVPKHNIPLEAENKETLTMDWSRIIAVLAIVAQVVTLALTFGTGLIPVDVQVILSGVLGFISAITQRVQGTPES